MRTQIRRLALLGVALALLATAPKVLAQLTAETSPEELISFVSRKPLDEEAPKAIEYLLKGRDPESVRPALVAAAGEAKKSFARVLLASAAVAMGDESMVGEVLETLQGDDDSFRAAALRPLVFGKPVAPIMSHLDAIVAKSGSESKALAMAVQEDWLVKSQGSGAGTFLLLIALCGIGGLGYVVSLAKNVDVLKGKVLTWASTPLERDRILKELRAMPESPLPKLVTYLDKNLTSDELAGLLDLISHFDEPAAHEKIREFANHRHDLVKGAAILAMTKLSGPQWIQEIAGYLEQGDPTQSGFAAKALAELRAIDYLPRIQELHNHATGATKDFYREAIERLSPRT